MNNSPLIRDLTEEELKKCNLHPQAIINKSMSYFESLGIKFSRQCDDLSELDEYTFMLMYDDNEIPCMFYDRGHPIKDTMSVSLPINFSEQQVVLALDEILSYFDLSDKDVYWKRGEYYDNQGNVDRIRRIEEGR